MVLPYSKRVPPKSFVRSRTLKTEVSKYSRPARTPPSTFLFLHLHLSNSPGSENPTPRGGEVVKTLTRRQMTTDWDRLFFTHHHEELDGHDKLPWPRGQCSAALSGRVIGPPNWRCQRLRQQNFTSKARILQS